MGPTDWPWSHAGSLADTCVTLRDDLPFAVGLLARSTARRFGSVLTSGARDGTGGSPQPPGHAAGKPPGQRPAAEEN
jgi:hypothetical protein